SSQNQFLTHPKLDELELAIPTVLVLVPTILIVGLVVVLHGRKTGWPSVADAGQLRYEWAPPQVTQLCSLEMSACREVEL
ncbi:hypothetical protein Tco_0406735, partial [Tanacetum coccineum]